MKKYKNLRPDEAGWSDVETKPDVDINPDTDTNSDAAAPIAPPRKHLLIYAHYYEALASTGAILKDLAQGLLPQFRVTVICVVPSYLGAVDDRFKKQKYYFENVNGVDVIRVRVPDFQKGQKASRIKNILTYFFRAIWATGKMNGKDSAENVDYIISISQPPVLGGLLGTWGKWIMKAKYIYSIQDINPEQIEAVGFFRFRPLLWLLRRLDTFSCSQADLIVTVGRDLVETIEKRFQKKPEAMPHIALINNWMDEKEIYPLPDNHPKVVEFRRKYGLEGAAVIAYSGNLGHYYDLTGLLKVIRKFRPGTKTPDGREVVFAFIGGGARRDAMVEYVEENHMDNVVFIPYQDKEDLIYSLNAADVHWCVNAKGIKGVSCPSKYYGIAAVGKPVLGVLEKGTEIRRIIEETNGGLCCEPGDYEAVEANVKWFIENAGNAAVRSMGGRSREYLVRNLTRERSVQKYAEEIMKLTEEGPIAKRNSLHFMPERKSI